MGITVIPNCCQKDKPVAPVGPRKISDVQLTGKYYRHPDSALISYPLVVQDPLGSINKKLNIAIIGVGAAGIASLYELSRLENSKENIRVTLYENDSDHFAVTKKNTPMKKAGRIFAAASADATHHTVYEIGAMRFPEIAGLTWHYASQVFDNDTPVKPFPNPGKIPTEFVHGERVDRYMNDTWLDKDSPTKKVVDVALKGLFGQAEGENTSIFLIGEKDPAKISEELKSEKTTEQRLKEIDEQWKIYATEFDKVTLGSAVRQVIQAKFQLLPDVDGLQTDTDKVNYYVELFGCFGFGTGGMKSLYNVSFLEIMRLLLWNYANEYTLPVEENVIFLRNLYNKAKENNPNIEIKHARVCDVGHLEQNTSGDALVVYYDINDDGNEDTNPQVKIYDYVILATTPRTTSYMVSRIGFNNVARPVILGDYERKLADKLNVRPALVLSNKFDAPNSKLYSALNHIHMASSSKIYGTITKSKFDAKAPDFLGQGKIKAVISDCGLASSYVVPSSVANQAEDYYTFLISYTWEDDTKRLQHHFGKYPMNSGLDTKPMMNTVINRTSRYIKDPVDGAFNPWWFGEVMSGCNITDTLSYDWTTHHTSGGFKLDAVGDYYNSHLLFRYHTHALDASLKNKFFLANCSYSHVGGWLEGAFMSAVNAVCGLIVGSNQGDVNSLSVQARKVVQGLDNVVESEE